MNAQDKERIAQNMLFFTEKNSYARALVAFVMDKLDAGDMLMAPESLTRCDCGCEVIHGPIRDMNAPEGSEAAGDGNWGTVEDFQTMFAQIMHRARLGAGERDYVISQLKSRIKWCMN